MRHLALLVMLLCPETAFLQAQMNVSLCPAGKVRDGVIATAKAEAEFIFHAAGVQILWVPCTEFDHSVAPLAGPLFIVRLRTDSAPRLVGAASLDTMGMAFLSGVEGGRLADAYLPSIQSGAALYSTDEGALLGCVIAHELGHLLLGPGHTPNGVMHTGWRSQEARTINKRWLKFNREEAARLRRQLSEVTAAG